MTDKKDSKNITIQFETWQALNLFKTRLGLRSYDDVIKHLMKRKGVDIEEITSFLEKIDSLKQNFDS